MTNEPEIQNTNEASEFENFEKLAKKLFSLTPEEIEKLKEEEKAMGILPDEADFEPESEEEE
jgi:hypothetical protein